MSDHYHCPHGCEHPQPFAYDGKHYCGRCYFRFGELVECEECTAENCGEAVDAAKEGVRG